jgi:deoxyribodipyrimidine photo-lyase
MITLLWFSQDQRLTDNPALAAAIARGGPIVPFFVLDDLDAGKWPLGGASRWWLHGSLRALDDSLRQRGNALVLRRGSAETVINRLLDQTGADAVYWNRRYEPWATARGERLKTSLRIRGIEVRSFNSALIREPWTITTQNGEPYRVFTPFWKALRATGVSQPEAVTPASIPGPASAPESEALSSWALRPTAPDWAGGLQAMWTPGEAGAQARLREFAAHAVSEYRDKRNMPGVAGTSRLSPHLHFGEIGPRQIWRSITAEALTRTGSPMPTG